MLKQFTLALGTLVMARYLLHGISIFTYWLYGTVSLYTVFLLYLGAVSLITQVLYRQTKFCRGPITTLVRSSVALSLVMLGMYVLPEY